MPETVAAPKPGGMGCGPSPPLEQNIAPIGLHGAEGPDALQVAINTLIAVSDLDGCGRQGALLL